jgi:hypothetical protein
MMSFAALIAWAYVAGRTALIASYGPQLKKLYYDTTHAEAISLLTWTLWSASVLVSLAYAVLVVRDPTYLYSSATNAAAIMTVALLALRRRRVPHGPASPPLWMLVGLLLVVWAPAVLAVGYARTGLQASGPMQRALTTLFLVSFLPDMVSYASQVRSLVRDTTRGASFSLTTWVIWCAINLVSLLYASVCLHSRALSAYYGADLACCVVVCVFAVRARRRVGSVQGGELEVVRTA